eukprot:4951495-Amphidinium_carterae.1
MRFKNPKLTYVIVFGGSAYFDDLDEFPAFIKFPIPALLNRYRNKVQNTHNITYSKEALACKASTYMESTRHMLAFHPFHLQVPRKIKYLIISLPFNYINLFICTSTSISTATSTSTLSCTSNSTSTLVSGTFQQHLHHRLCPQQHQAAR